MRLIDADALKHPLLEFVESSDLISSHWISRVVDIICDTPTVMQWVSVENELPPPETLVLVYHRAGFFQKGVNETMQVAIGSYSNKWYSGFTGIGLLGVTHWMPLPPPPGKYKPAEEVSYETD